MGVLAQVDKSRPAVNHAARSIRFAPVLVVTFVLCLFSFFAPSSTVEALNKRS